MSNLEITEVVLVHCNIVNNNYQQNSRSCIHLFLINRLVNYLVLKMVWKHFMFLKTFDSEFSYIEVWFIDQNSKPLETEDEMSITLKYNI